MEQSYNPRGLRPSSGWRRWGLVIGLAVSAAVALLGVGLTCTTLMPMLDPWGPKPWGQPGGQALLWVGPALVAAGVAGLVAFLIALAGDRWGLAIGLAVSAVVALLGTGLTCIALMTIPYGQAWLWIGPALVAVGVVGLVAFLIALARDR
jgi:hypothetical protein